MPWTCSTAGPHQLRMESKVLKSITAACHQALGTGGMGKHAGHTRGSSAAAARSVQRCSAPSCFGCHVGWQELLCAPHVAWTGRSRKSWPRPWGSGAASGPPPLGSSGAWPWDPGWGRRVLAEPSSERLLLRSSHPNGDLQACRTGVVPQDRGAPIRLGYVPRLVYSCPLTFCRSSSLVAPHQSYIRHSLMSGDLNKKRTYKQWVIQRKLIGT